MGAATTEHMKTTVRVRNFQFAKLKQGAQIEQRTNDLAVSAGVGAAPQHTVRHAANNLAAPKVDAVVVALRLTHLYPGTDLGAHWDRAIRQAFSCVREQARYAQCRVSRRNYW